MKNLFYKGIYFGFKMHITNQPIDIILIKYYKNFIVLIPDLEVVYTASKYKHNTFKYLNLYMDSVTSLKVANAVHYAIKLIRICGCSHV